MAVLRGYGYTGAGFPGPNAVIGLYSSENFTPNANGAYVSFFTTPNGTNSISERMRISHDGNLGIGTTTPHALLQFKNGANNRMLVLYEDADNNHNFLGFGINNYILRYQVSNTANNHVFYAGTSPTTSNELMRIQGNGNVGVNIPAPLAKLHVNGNTILTDTSDIANVQIGAVDYTLAKMYLKNTNYQDGLYIDSPLSTGGDALRVVGTSRLSGNTQVENNLTVGGTTNLGNATINSANISNATIGALSVTGNLSKPSGSFKIDHPLDPENKILYHSFVESPDMMNVYNGNVVTDKKGVAIVTLPDYFEALNTDFRYQLTVIGSFSQAMIFEKVKNNQFKIKTQKPNVEVSWQVTGVRNDAYARKFRIPNTVEKSEAEKGKYLYPAAFDKQ